MDTERQMITNYLRNTKALAFLKTKFDQCMKNTEFSNNKRLEGNSLYQKSSCNSQEIFRNYTASIAYAPPHSETLALAYGNRSALLHRVGKYKECILDIDRALKIDKCNATLRIKLLCRKVECLVTQGSPDCNKVYEEAANLLSKIRDESNNNSSMQTSMKNIEKAREALSKFKNVEVIVKEETPEHMKILKEKEEENPFNTVTIKFNGKCGRHFIADRDIKAGEIIFVEKPYVSCLNRNSFHIYCGHCFTKSWTTIPCDCCNWCMFCSEKCKDEAWANYHSIECYTMSYLLLPRFEINHFDHLSLRCLLMGIKDSGSISNLKNDLQCADEWIDQSKKSTFPNKMFETTGFKSIYTLYSEVPQQRMEKYSLNSTLILISLARFTSLFGSNSKFEEVKDFIDNEDALFIGSVLLKLRIRNQASAVEIQKSPGLNSYKVTTAKGVCTPALTFFIKHSCNPNTEKCMTNDGRFIVFALQPIKKNSQLFISRLQKYYENDMPMRQTLIRQRMNFFCSCQACIDNWPTLVKMYKFPKQQPISYIRNFNKIESDLFDENNLLVGPILHNYKKKEFNQTTIMQLSQAMEKACKWLEHPTVVICELMISLGIVFERLYSSDLSR